MTTAHNPDTPVAPAPLNANGAEITVKNTKPNNKIGDHNTVRTEPSTSDNTTQSKTVRRQPGKNLDGVASPAPDTGGLLDDVRSFFADYIVFPAEHDMDVVALWTVHAWALDALEVSPRLVLVSPEPACGKTRVLELLTMLCPTTEFTYLPNAKKLRKSIADNDNQTPTILVDEADSIFGTNGTRNPELRALINTSYRRGPGLTSGDGEDGGATTSWGFAPFAVAGLSGSIPATITSRAITITMRPPGATTPAKTYQRGEVVERAGELRERLLSWGRHGVARLAGIDPVLPAGLRDRPAEVWQPLLAIAELANGSWPERARAACSAYAEDARSAVTLSPGLQLLSDIRAVFRDKDRMLSEDLVAAVVADPENPWSERGRCALDARRLARELQPYGVRTRSMRTETGRGRGYFADGETGLTQAWERWLPRAGVDDADQLADGVTDAPHVTDVAEATVTAKETTDQGKQGAVTDVTHVTDKPTLPRSTPADSPKTGNGSSTPVPMRTGSQPDKAPARAHIPGDPTSNTPGQTDRVERIVARASNHGVPEAEKPDKQASNA